MTSLRNKIIAGVLGIALTTTVGATAIMHDSGNTAEETTTTSTTTSTTTATTTTTSTTTTTTTPTTTKEVTTTMTATTTIPDDDFIPIVTETEPQIVRRYYDLDIRGDDTVIYQAIIRNDGMAIIYYRRGGEGLDEKWGTIPTKAELTDSDGNVAITDSLGYPSTFFKSINPLSTTFTLKIAFEDLEEQTIEIVLPDEYTQK